MADLNKVMILGNVGRDPEMRYTAQGNEITTFTVAANRNYRKPDGEWGQETEWFNVVTWGELARRMAQNLQKGDRVYVEGRLQTRSWEGPDGQRRSRAEGRQEAAALRAAAQSVCLLRREGSGHRLQRPEPAAALPL